MSNNSPTPPVRRQSIHPMVKKFNTHVWLHPNSPIFAPWTFLSVSLRNPTFRNWIGRTYSESKLRNFRVYNFAKRYTNLQTASSICNATLHHYARHHLYRALQSSFKNQTPTYVSTHSSMLKIRFLWLNVI